MQLNLIRRIMTDVSTIGTLDIDNERYCYTLERNEVRIPEGSYNIEMTFSPRFQRMLPLLDSVPGRSEVRIHSGNWPRDTEGCILVGLQKGKDMILASRAALDPLVTKIQAALDAHDEVRIVIS